MPPQAAIDVTLDNGIVDTSTAGHMTVNALGPTHYSVAAFIAITNNAIESSTNTISGGGYAFVANANVNGDSGLILGWQDGIGPGTTLNSGGVTVSWTPNSGSNTFADAFQFTLVEVIPAIRPTGYLPLELGPNSVGPTFFARQPLPQLRQTLASTAGTGTGTFTFSGSATGITQGAPVEPIYLPQELGPKAVGPTFLARRPLPQALPVVKYAATGSGSFSFSGTAIGTVTGLRQAAGIDGAGTTITATFGEATLVGSGILAVYTSVNGVAPTVPAGFVELGSPIAALYGGATWYLYLYPDASSISSVEFTALGATAFPALMIAEFEGLGLTAELNVTAHNGVAETTVNETMTISALGPSTLGPLAAFVAIQSNDPTSQITGFTGTGWTYVTGTGQNGDTNNVLAWQSPMAEGTTYPSETVSWSSSSSRGPGYYADALQFTIVEMESVIATGSGYYSFSGNAIVAGTETTLEPTAIGGTALTQGSNVIGGVTPLSMAVSASGRFVFSGTATGSTTLFATATGIYTFTGVASVASATGIFVFTASATGTIVGPTPTPPGPYQPVSLGAGAPLSYVCCDLMSGTILGTLPLTGVTFGKTLNGIGQFQGTIDLADPNITEMFPLTRTIPALTAIFVDYNGALIWGGVIWPRQRNMSPPQSRKMTITASDLWSYLANSRVQATDYSAPPYSGITGPTVPMPIWNANYQPSGGPAAEWDAVLIAWQVMADALSLNYGNILGGMGIAANGYTTAAAYLASGTATSDLYYVNQTFPFSSLQTIGTIVSQLTQLGMGVGPDIGVDVAYSDGPLSVPVATVNISYPRRGLAYTSPGSTLTVDLATARSYSFPEDGTQAANVIYEIGGAGAITAVENIFPLQAGYPLLESVKSRSQVTSSLVQDILYEIGLSDLSLYSYPVVVPTFTTDLFGANPALGQFIEGDDIIVTIPATDGVGNVWDPGFPSGMYLPWRITAWTATVGDYGDSTLQVTLGTPPTFNAADSPVQPLLVGPGEGGGTLPSD
jgi:hypothetical protein